MELLATIGLSDLAKFQQRGADPKKTVEALLNEAKLRFPAYPTVVMLRGKTHPGFDIWGA